MIRGRVCRVANQKQEDGNKLAKYGRNFNASVQVAVQRFIVYIPLHLTEL